MAKAVLPRVHVMVLCDEIEPSAEEAEVFDLRGVRTYIAAPAFPYAHPQLCVYLQLTGHEGTASGEIRIVLAETDDTVYRQEVGPVPFVGPLVLVPLRAWLTDCEFSDAGLYYVQVYFGQKIIAERPLWLTQSEGGSNGQVPE